MKCSDFAHFNEDQKNLKTPTECQKFSNEGLTAFKNYLTMKQIGMFNAME